VSRKAYQVKGGSFRVLHGAPSVELARVAWAVPLPHSTMRSVHLVMGVHAVLCVRADSWGSRWPE
jgi:hypothetical protein